ncbi:MAG: hypothetical protein V4608_17015 [Bacteroidota bacterium]
MTIRNKISIFFLCIFITPFASFSQTSKEAIPVFILQGAAKLKGKPIDGVSLALKKDGKQIAKFITPKNGLYYFEMNKSNTDPQHEYHLNILKDGITAGTLRINTYTPKEDFVPYIFNLDFNLNPPTGAGTMGIRDFGRIKWNTESNVFDFDKNYFIIVEREKQKRDSINNILEQAKIKKEAQLEKELDSLIAYEAVVKRRDSLAAKAYADAEKTSIENKDNPISNIKANNGSESAKTKITNASTDAKGDISKQKNKTEEVNQNSKDKIDRNATIAAAAKEKEMKKQVAANNIAALRNKENVLDIAKKNEAQEKLRAAEAAKLLNSQAKLDESKKGPSTNYQNDSILAFREKRKDVFFLTGVPMGQFKKDLSAATPDESVFDASDVFSTNNERSRMFSEKERMARKKAENLAKKHETNNTLTSLMNEVEEYDKK